MGTASVLMKTRRGLRQQRNGVDGSSRQQAQRQDEPRAVIRATRGRSTLGLARHAKVLEVDVV